jgi:putative Mg2+ transporter-C (MgtC) family protein
MAKATAVGPARLGSEFNPASPMDVDITAYDIAIRLALTMLAGAVIGFNRSQRGRTAGLRTTILVGLAAAASMIEANILLGAHQEGPASYIRLDVMRLPLGVLSGIGFIGAGAIIKRHDLVQGVTTAATLWLVTVIGIIFGGGQLVLGGAITVIAFIVLWLLKLGEDRMRQEQRGALILGLAGPSPSDDEVKAVIGRDGHRITAWSPVVEQGGARRELFIDVAWRQKGVASFPPPFVDQLVRLPGVERTEWKPRSEDATAH